MSQHPLWEKVGPGTTRPQFPPAPVSPPVSPRRKSDPVPGPSFPAPVSPEWRYEIVDGLPNPIVKSGFIDVWDRPGLGVSFKVQAAKSHLSAEDRNFFD